MKPQLSGVVCPSDNKNSVTKQGYKSKTSAPDSSAHSSISQLPLKASLTWNKLVGGLLSSPGMVALAISRPSCAMLKKRPLVVCSMILPQFQCIWKRVSHSSRCPLAITVLWRLCREHWEQRRKARN